MNFTFGRLLLFESVPVSIVIVVGSARIFVVVRECMVTLCVGSGVFVVVVFAAVLIAAWAHTAMSQVVVSMIVQMWLLFVRRNS